MAENGVIGRENQLPWRLSADLQRFKKLTMGHTIIMGRKTYESIGRPLPGRRTIVVSRNPAYRADGLEVVGSLPAAIQLATSAVAEGAANAEQFIVGGSELFRLALPLAQRLYLTRVQATVAGDVYFPPIDWSNWQRAEQIEHSADEKNQFAYSFETYDRH